MLAVIVGLMLVSADAQSGTPRTRTVDIAKDTFFHSEPVVGELNAETTLEFPELVTMIRCSDCEVIVTDTKPDAEPDAPGHNWIITRDPKAHPGYVHITPAELPSRDNPVAAFSGKVTVILASRHKVHIDLSLRDPMTEKAPYDHWVAFKIPGHETVGAQLKSKLDKAAAALKDDFDDAVNATVAKFFLRRPRCSPLSWLKPKIEKKTKAWVTELCITREEPRTYVVLFAVENAGADLLTLTGVALEPQGDFAPDVEPKIHTYFPKEPIAFRGQVRAAVIYEVPRGSRQPPSWTLRVTPSSRPEVIVKSITFGHLGTGDDG